MGSASFAAVLPGSWTRESTSHNSICTILMTTLSSIASSATTSPVVGGYLVFQRVFSPDLKRHRVYIVPEAGGLVSEAGASESRRTS